MTGSTLVLAVDGGGTKTEAALLDADGRTLGAGRAGPCQLFRDPAAALDAFAAAFHAAAAAAGLPPDPDRIVLSAALAGTSAPAGLARFAAGLPRFQRTFVSSDAYAALLGAFDAGPGVLVIGGTGSVACRWDGAALTRIGGWGFPHGDAGSGAAIGLRLVAAWLEHRDGMRPADPAFDGLAARLGEDPGTILARLRAAGPADYAALFPALLAAGEAGSPLAATLLDAAADDLARHASALLRPGLDLALGGGVALALAPRIAARLGLAAPPRRADPIRGAWLVAAGRAPPDVTLPEAPSCASSA